MPVNTKELKPPILQQTTSSKSEVTDLVPREVDIQCSSQRKGVSQYCQSVSQSLLPVIKIKEWSYMLHIYPRLQNLIYAFSCGDMGWYAQVCNTSRLFCHDPLTPSKTANIVPVLVQYRCVPKVLVPRLVWYL